MTVSLRDCMDRIADPVNLDASVAEVFRMMLGSECEVMQGALPQEDEMVSAVVGFGGVLSGGCVYRSGGSTARAIAERLTGTHFLNLDDTVKDAVGEMCNMLAGTWKGRIPELAARCGLSVPAVITGRDYKLRMQSPQFRFQRVYGFEGARFELTLMCGGIA